jgi:nucleoside-diphosphate-sugar epimerase
MSARCVLLTGFPRCEVARRVMGELLRDPRVGEIHCIVPERYMTIAREWVHAVSQVDQSRVTLWLGDVASIDLALTGSEFGELCERVEVIHHCAAVTYTGAPEALAESVNVGGTYEVLELARNAKRLSRFVHWSTTSATWDRDGVVYEDELLTPHATPLLMTRHRAECAVQRARAELPVVVLRPAMLVGDSESGQLERIDGAHLLISGLLSAPRDVAMPRPARGDALLHVVPIDYAVRAGLVLAAADQAAGRTFHIVDATPPTLHEALTAIAEILQRPPPRGSMPTPLARALVRLPGVDQLVHAERALIDELGRAVVYSDQHARPILSLAGLSCPAFTSYVGKLVASVERMRKSGERPLFPALGAP